MLEDQTPSGTGTVLNLFEAEKCFKPNYSFKRAGDQLSFQERLKNPTSVVLWTLMFLWQNIEHCCLGICIGRCLRFKINASSNIRTKLLDISLATRQTSAKNEKNADYLICSNFLITIKQLFHYHMLSIFCSIFPFIPLKFFQIGNIFQNFFKRLTKNI